MANIEYLVQVNAPVERRANNRSQNMFVPSVRRGGLDTLIRVDQSNILHHTIPIKADCERISDDAGWVLVGIPDVDVSQCSGTAHRNERRVRCLASAEIHFASRPHQYPAA